MPADARPIPSRWWNSFYWRLGLSFLGLVTAIMLAQSLIFIYWVETSGRGASRRPYFRTSLQLAAELRTALERDELGDINAFLAERFGRQHTLHVILDDGRFGSTDPALLSPRIRHSADLMFRGDPPSETDDFRFPAPIAFAPVQVRGQLRGLAITVPRQQAGVLRDIERFLTLPGLAFLFIATVAAAAFTFGPARGRLAALEAAAMRIAAGDLTARAVEAGKDEISRVARAFNRMGVELAARDEALRTSDRLRRQLLADVSHELKTPLTSMRGYVETLQLNDTQLDAERRRRYLDTVAGETLRLERIVADLIDLARHENSVGALDLRVFAVARLFDVVVRRHEREAEERAITLAVDVSDPLDQIHADPNRLEQVVDNLVANALRYVPDGGVIGLTAEAHDSTVIVRVTDSGAGISADHLPHVFDRFYKGDPARAAGTPGSGLGLSIVKAIVERHSGTVTVASRPGHTAFTVTLPGAVVSPEEAPKVPTSTRESARAG